MAFSAFEIDKLELTPLLFQTGYLTIKDYDKRKRQYKLYYPNFEVKESFLTYIAESLSKVESYEVNSYLLKCIKALRKNDHDLFFENLKVFFADINYELHIKHEKYYQTIFYVIFKLIGLKTQAEVSTNIGRVDAVIEVEDKVYLFEFKLNATDKAALKQIENKKYFEKYKNKGKQIICIGVEFDKETRNIKRWTVKGENQNA